MPWRRRWAFGEAFFGLLASGWDIDTFGQPGVPACRPIAAAELGRIRGRHRELNGRWLALAAGETLELPFPEAPHGSITTGRAS